jgi:glutaconate CoA-transferase subunit A
VIGSPIPKAKFGHRLGFDQSTDVDVVINTMRSGMRVGLGGFWFVRTPMALVDALLESEARDLEIVTFGGGLALERLLEAGRVRRIYFCFNSMDVLGAAPAFRRTVESGSVEAVELTVLIMSKALQAVHENVPFLPIRGPLGSDFLTSGFPLYPIQSPISEEQLWAVPPLPLDLALIHATSADIAGNVEIVGARGLDRRILSAAKTRVVSVESIEGTFRGPEKAHRTTFPRFMVDHVVKVPGGAKPSSCLPFYSTDFRTLRNTLYGPPGPRLTPAPPSNDPAPTPAELMVYLMARQLKDGGVYTVGSVTPMAMVAYQLAKRTTAPNLALIPFAGLVDVGLYPVGVSTAESNALASADDFWGMDDLYEWMYQRGSIDAEIFTPAQIDANARVNNSKVFRSDGSLVRLPGQAGIADVALLHGNLVMYVPRHTLQRFVSEVDWLGGDRHLFKADERQRANLSPGRVVVVTNLCQLEYDIDRMQFRVATLHPGVSLEEVQSNTGFPLLATDGLPISPVPAPDILRMIRVDIDPNRVRELEFVASADRLPALDLILDQELVSRHSDGLPHPIDSSEEAHGLPEPR